MSDQSKLSNQQNPLGQTVEYVSTYQPQLLFAIAREEKRVEIGITGDLPFVGEDIWNAYEVSWLNLNGVPRVATAEFRFPADSPNIIESKSFKLYLNSFNQTKFESLESVMQTIKQDLEAASLASVEVRIDEVGIKPANLDESADVTCIDHIDIAIDSYEYNPDLLKSKLSLDETSSIEESLCSHILKSNCLITSQPDWASIFIRYHGTPIDHARLLAYIISFRNHNEFHEQCVERIYSDIMSHCKPDKLTVYARYTRRGGLDINPWRSNFESNMPNNRLIRQ
ncbi:MAG: NADPH-dependent 7-cyano-7-deazaguanine reductase QueF [Kangiellaceae bacterium]